MKIKCSDNSDESAVNRHLSTVNRSSSNLMTCHIKENSWIASLAAKKLKTKTVAIVVGRTIHLHNATRNDLLQNQRWLRHEVRHLLQFQQYGLIRFILLYLFESVRNGYRNNKYELEARASEKDDKIVNGIQFQ